MKIRRATSKEFATVVGCGPVGIRVASILTKYGLKVTQIDSGHHNHIANNQTTFSTNMSASNKYIPHSISAWPPINPWGGCLMGYRWEKTVYEQYKHIVENLTERVFEETAEYFSVPHFDFSTDTMIGGDTTHFEGIKPSFGVFTPDPLLTQQRLKLKRCENYTFISGQRVLG